MWFMRLPAYTHKASLVFALDFNPAMQQIHQSWWGISSHASLCDVFSHKAPDVLILLKSSNVSHQKEILSAYNKLSSHYGNPTPL